MKRKTTNISLLRNVAFKNEQAVANALLSACPAYSGLADFGLEKTLPLYFVDEKHLVGI